MPPKQRTPFSRRGPVWIGVVLALLGALPLQAQRVTDVLPRSVSLTGGEEAVQVEIRGAFPRPIERVEIRDLGGAVRDPSARILRAGRDRILVELSATDRVRATRDLQVILITQDRSELRVPLELQVLEAMPTAASVPQTVTHQVGTFQVTLAPLPPPTALGPVEMNVGAFVVSLAPVEAAAPIEPVTHNVGTFQITLSPSPGGES